ncbi:MAG: DUF7178 family protein [Streptosporangiaceae bacterium]
MATDDELAAYAGNITAAFRAATPEQVAHGRQWCPVAHNLAVITGGGDVRKGAGMLAALSAQRPWEVNVGLAEDAANGDLHGHTEAVLAEVRVIMEGADPAEVLPMEMKPGRFYRCMVDPSAPDPVVIDRHAHDVAAGERYGSRSRGPVQCQPLRDPGAGLPAGRARAGEIPQVVQAVVWVGQADQKGM